MQKKVIFIILFILLYVILLGIYNKVKLGKENNIVDIKFFINNKCIDCTSLNDYIKVFKKSGVSFGNITTYIYGTKEYETNSKLYNIKKLPFIVFSNELDKYETISNSWNDTFGYKNKKGEFISDDIIPPYFDLETKKVKGLVDMIYIGDKTCLDCYKQEDIEKILLSFGIRFKDINNIDIKSEKSLKLIDEYNIKTFPVVILSENMNLYKNFSYFWKNIGTVEEDGKYILKNPGKLGLNFKNKIIYEK